MSEARRNRPRVFLPRASLMVAAALIGIGIASAPKAKAANVFWDTNSTSANLGGAAGSWSGSNWYNAGTATSASGTDATSTATFGAGDFAYFAGTAGTVTLDTTITVGGLNFGTAGYTLASSGPALTLGSAGYTATGFAGEPRGITLSTAPSSLLTTISANTVLANSQNWNASLFNNLVLSGVLSQGATVSGLSKDGFGTVALTNANTYAGMTTVRDGILSLGTATSAGTGASPIRNGGDGTLGGGTLMLAASNPYEGFTLERNLELQGSGVRTADSRTLGDSAAFARAAQGALASVGNNTVSGAVTFSSAVVSRIASLSGMLTLSGTVTLGAGQTTTVAGGGNTNITGLIPATTGGLIKAGGTALASTLILGNSGNAFTGTVLASGGTIRVANAGALGLSTAGAAMEFNNGTLEVRADSSNVGSFSTKNVSTSSNSGTIFLDRAIGGYGAGNLNQTVDFGSFVFGNTRTLTLNGRNGYRFSIGTVGAKDDVS